MIAGGFTNSQQVLACDRKSANERGIELLERFFEDTQRLEVFASCGDGFCGGITAVYSIIVQGLGQISDGSPPPVTTVKIQNSQSPQ